MSAQRRGPWSQAEDAYLCQLVHTQGALNWVRIAQLIGSRSPKQCRERYHQNLKPTLNHEPISPEEGLLIERLVGEMGKRWADIARRLNGRSDNAVKNWWNGSMNRRRRLVLRRGHATQEHNNFDERTQTLSFARPAINRQLTIQNPNYPPVQAIDGPLLSPASSEASKADSMDGAPSLVSDNGSAFSISPRLAYSPGNDRELPLLHSLGRENFNDQRRPSLPSLHDLQRGLHFENERPVHVRGFVRFDDHSNADQAISTLASQFYPRPEPQQYALPSALSPRKEMRECSPKYYQPITAPATPLQLPPLRMSVSESHNSPHERDNRMNLSSLLG